MTAIKRFQNFIRNKSFCVDQNRRLSKWMIRTNLVAYYLSALHTTKHITFIFFVLNRFGWFFFNFEFSKQGWPAHRDLLEVVWFALWANLSLPNWDMKNIQLMHQFFYNMVKKERDECTTFLTFVVRWSLVDLCWWCLFYLNNFHT